MISENKTNLFERGYQISFYFSSSSLMLVQIFYMLRDFFSKAVCFLMVKTVALQFIETERFLR